MAIKVANLYHSIDGCEVCVYRDLKIWRQHVRILAICTQKPKKWEK